MLIVQSNPDIYSRDLRQATVLKRCRPSSIDRLYFSNMPALSFVEKVVTTAS